MDSDATTPAEDLAALKYGSFVIVRDAAGTLRMLGEGTFGRTYLARHQYLNTLAALKVITDRFATEHAARERFLSEGRALVRLDHRHIARLHDFGEAGGALFYAMEYCAGGDLAQRMKSSGALPLSEWMQVARQLASALECCHAAGFFHRDIKPSNIMLARPDGPLVTKLIDFGLVQAELTDPTGDANLVGTPLYASPEQLREEPIDARSDLFSLGMTLWHLALGTPPETGTSAKIIASRLSKESYAALLPAQLPTPLRTLLAQLVEKDHTQRIASAEELSGRLAEAVRTLGLPATAGESATRTRVPTRSVAPSTPAPESEQTLVASPVTRPGTAAASHAQLRTPPPAPSPRATRSAPDAFPSSPVQPIARRSVLKPVLALAVLSAVAAAAFVFVKPLFMGKGATQLETRESNAFPATATIDLAGDFPQQCTFSVNGAPAQARFDAGLWRVPVGGQQPPLDVSAVAPGYRPAVIRIAGLGEINTPHPLTFERNKGTLIFTRNGPSDYSRATVKMEEALPAESGVVTVERVTRSKGFINPEERLELATGKWLVTLEGANGRVVRPRIFQRVEIEDRSEKICALPRTIAGTFKGSLRDRDGAGDAELLIEMGLTEGTITDTRGGISRRGRVEGFRVDGSGALTALAKFSHSAEAPGYDEQITAMLVGEAGDLEVKIVEALTDEESVKKRMNRAPFAETEWSRTGTLQRRR